jgi:biopolymer transport protein ExbB
MTPLALVGFICLIIIFDKLIFIINSTKLSKKISDIFDDQIFNRDKFHKEFLKIKKNNCYYEFLKAIDSYENQPIANFENKLINIAKKFEKKFGGNLWILETIITSAPLLGLLGTIFGMSFAFKVMGKDVAISANGISTGVAESLIATAFGLVIAVISLIAFNYFHKTQNYILDEMEMLGSKIIQHLKFENNII